MLKEILSQKNYSFADHFDSWQDAIKASYKPMIEHGVVEDIYVDAVIECVNKYGPYIVIAPDIAMPHSTENAKGCNDTAIAFMKVKEPVDFDPADPEKKARLFFSLAATDHEKHIGNIQALMDTLMNEDIVNALLEADDEEAFKKVVETYEGEKS